MFSADSDGKYACGCKHSGCSEPYTCDPHRGIREDILLHNVYKVVFVRIKYPKVVVKEYVMKHSEYARKIYYAKYGNDRGKNGNETQRPQTTAGKKS